MHRCKQFRIQIPKLTTMTCELLISFVLLFVSIKVSWSFQSVVEIPRMSIEKFHKVYNENGRQTPVVVENVLSEISCEDVCDVIASSKDLRVDLQRKRPDTPTEIYEANIEQAIKAIIENPTSQLLNLPVKTPIPM